MGKLYPPNINGTIPAFSGTTLVVPFSLNRATAISDVYSVKCKIKTVSGVLKETVDIKSIDTVAALYGEFELTESYSVGQYYKVQLAFIDEDGNVGYYSTVGVTKCTSVPTVTIEGLDATAINSHNYYYTGVYSQNGGDTTEKLYSSRFEITNSVGETVADTGYILHNVSQDTSSYEATESYHLAQDLSLTDVFFIQFSVITTNGMEKKSKRYRISQKRSVDPELNVDLIATGNSESGFVELTFSNSSKKLISGTFLISRCGSDENNTWTDFKRFNLHAIPADEFSLKDCSIAQGVKYVYSLQQYNQNGLYSERILSNTVSVDFEDAFLYDGEKQLSIKYNPKISSFKTDYADQKTDTIGSKHPFIIRNGNMAYKEFPISGLISYKMDEANNMFMEMSDLGIEQSSTDLTIDNIAAERIFKMKVLDWLNDGKVKLFRSPTEGNFIIRLMNVSLAPQDSLGRMLHTFNATAYEMAEFNSTNLTKYNIIDSSEQLEEQMQWASVYIPTYISEKQSSAKELKNISKTLDGHTIYKLNSGQRVAYSVSFTELMPGTYIYLDDECIAIGATGAYAATSKDGFNYIGIDSRFINQGMCTYSFKAVSISMFGLINNLTIQDIPIRQFIGTNNFINSANHDIFEEVQDIRTDLVDKLMVRFIKRPLEYLYVDIPEAEVENFDPNGSTLYSDMDCTNEITLTSLDPLTIYQLRIKRSDYRNFRSEKYYVNKNTDMFSPYTDYYIDGYKAVFGTSKALEVSNDIYNVTIDNEVINLDEIEKYTLENPNDFESIITENGVLTEFGYSVQIKTYTFDEDDSETKNMKAAYELELQQYQNGLLDETKDYMSNYTSLQNVRNKYITYLTALQNAINEYRKAYGIT